MKKIISILLVLSMLLGCSAMAEMGVQVIGGPDTETEPVSLDDVKLNVEAEIDGYGIFLANSFEYANYLLAYKAGKGDRSDEVIYDSGNEAEFAMLKVDITNTTTTPRDFLANCEVKVVFDDVYEYGGWTYQQNYDNYTWTIYNDTYKAWSNKQNVLYAINAADNFAIKPMYQGHYIFGCTLPNAVVNSKKPLRMVITIDGNEITYNIRK